MPVKTVSEPYRTLAYFKHVTLIRKVFSCISISPKCNGQIKVTL